MTVRYWKFNILPAKSWKFMILPAKCWNSRLCPQNLDFSRLCPQNLRQYFDGKNRTSNLEAKQRETAGVEKVYWRHLLFVGLKQRRYRNFHWESQCLSPYYKVNCSEVSEIETTFLDTTVYKGERFEKEFSMCIHILSLLKHFSTHTSTVVTQEALKKVLSKDKLSGFLEQTLQNLHWKRTLKISKHALSWEATRNKK